MGLSFPSQYLNLRNFRLWGLLTWKECPNSHGTFTDVGGGLSVIVSNLCLKRIGPGVGEIWGEVSLPQYILRKFVCLGCVEEEGAMLR